jgi:hypothetical protein
MKWYGEVVGGLQFGGTAGRFGEKGGLKATTESGTETDDREVVPPGEISEIMWLLFCGISMKRGRLRELKKLI